jgi:hypothetical protein
MANNSFRNRAKNIPGAIRPPATNLTMVTVSGAVLASVLTLWTPILNAVFAGDATQRTRKDVFIALVAAAALITVADLFARAIATAASQRARPAPGSADVPTPKSRDMEAERPAPRHADKIWIAVEVDEDGGMHIVPRNGAPAVT